jgi:hypothetical protein
LVGFFLLRGEEAGFPRCCRSSLINSHATSFSRPHTILTSARIRNSLQIRIYIGAFAVHSTL